MDECAYWLWLVMVFGPANPRIWLLSRNFDTVDRFVSALEDGKVRGISGGERAKLCFAIMMQEHGNVLILDEPTNHLDLSSKEAIEEALQEYTGTIIFVSHDRYLLSKILKCMNITTFNHY